MSITRFGRFFLGWGTVHPPLIKRVVSMLSNPAIGSDDGYVDFATLSTLADIHQDRFRTELSSNGHESYSPIGVILTDPVV